MSIGPALNIAILTYLITCCIQDTFACARARPCHTARLRPNARDDRFEIDRRIDDASIIKIKSYDMWAILRGVDIKT